MVAIQNTEVIQSVREAARLSLSEGFPTQLQGNIVPVVDVTPDFHKKSIISSSSPTTTGATTILTTDAERFTYITAVQLGLVKNATCDVATGVIAVTGVIDGTTTTIAAIPVLTLTAERADIQIQFREPIKLDRNTAVSLTGTFTLGAMARTATVARYENYA